MPRSRRLAGADHDRGGRGQPQRAGAGDQQHRHRVRQRARGRMAGQQPAGQGGRGDAADGRHEARRDAVGELLHRQLGALRMVDQLDDARQHGVAADGGDAHDEAAVAIEAAADHRVAGALGHRQRFAGEQRFVEAGAALHHHAVGRHLVAGAHAQPSPSCTSSMATVLLAAVARGADRRVRLQFDQLADRLGGLALGALFHVAAARARRRGCRRPTRNRRGGACAATPGRL